MAFREMNRPNQTVGAVDFYLAEIHKKWLPFNEIHLLLAVTMTSMSGLCEQETNSILTQCSLKTP